MPHIAKHINGLPYQAVNSLFFLRLEHDVVHLSDMAIKHICERHPHDYELCLASIEIIIIEPDYVGQSPLHPDNFVLIKQVMDSFLMIAISTIPDEYGEYPVQSAYVVDSGALQRRLRKGYLKKIKKDIV